MLPTSDLKEPFRTRIFKGDMSIGISELRRKRSLQVPIYFSDSCQALQDIVRQISSRFLLNDPSRRLAVAEAIKETESLIMRTVLMAISLGHA